MKADGVDLDDERDIWQIQLPDGYRRRYLIDKVARLVSVVYLGPHPDHDPRDREHALRSGIKRRRYRHC